MADKQSKITATIRYANRNKEVTSDLQGWVKRSTVFPIEEPVQFTGFFPTLLTTDVPGSFEDYPLFSKRFLVALEQAPPFKKRVISTIIQDDVGDSGRSDYELGRTTDDFVLIQTYEILNALDYEASRYRQRDEETGLARFVDRMVLKTPEDGFPTMFRVADAPIELLVSDEAKRILEAANLSDLEFVEVRAT